MSTYRLAICEDDAAICGDRVSIIFVTGCEDYLPEGYSVQPIHFLLKPVGRAYYKALQSAFIRYMNR